MTSCNIIRDLLTLYVDDLCSEESRCLVEEHLPQCPQCQQALEGFREAAETVCVNEQSAFRRFSGGLRRRNFKRLALSTVAAVLGALLLGVLAWVPEFPIDWQEGLAEAVVPVDEGVDVYIHASNYKTAYAVPRYNEDGSYDVYLTVVQNAVTRVVPCMDKSDNFVRLGNHLCVSYKPGYQRLLFAVSGDAVGLRNIYYVGLSQKQLLAAYAEDFHGVDAELIWSAP